MWRGIEKLMGGENIFVIIDEDVSNAFIQTIEVD